MKLHAAISPYHASYYNTYLRPTAEKEFELVVTSTETQPENVLLFKAQSILAQLYECQKRNEPYYFWCDNDAVFVLPCAELMLAELNRGYDAVFQNTRGELCPGVFAARVTQKFIDFWEVVTNDYDSYQGPDNCGDQSAVRKHQKMINAGMLPEQEFWSPCALRGGVAPVGESNWLPASLPPKLRMCHATCVRCQNKELLLDHVLKHTRNGTL